MPVLIDVEKEQTGGDWDIEKGIPILLNKDQKQ